MIGLHLPHLGKRRLEGLVSGVPGVHAGDHRADEHTGGLLSAPARGERGDAFVDPFGTPPRERLPSDSQLPGPRQHVGPEERRGGGRHTPDSAGAPDPSDGGLLVGAAHAIFEAESTHERRGRGDVVEKPVRAPFEHEAVLAIGADVAPDPLAGLETDHLRVGSDPLEQLVRDRQAGYPGPDDDNPRRDGTPPAEPSSVAGCEEVGSEG